uniref:Transposase Tc1-like domain-containing protein n=1 Tax=Cyprinus carpio TaxID=7962 RepID=A0A8C1Y9L7_CYPCA
MVSQSSSVGYTIMGKTADLTVVQKTTTDTLHKEGKTQKVIAKEAGCSQSSVSKHINREAKGRKRCGRKQCTSNRDNRTLERIVKQNPLKNVGEIHKEWTAAGVSASRTTTHRRMQDMGFSCRIPCVKPLLNNKQRQKCLKTKKDWTAAEWSKVMFSDESKFCISFGNQGPRVWRKRGEAHNPCCLRSSVKFPQSVMVWGAMSSAGVGPLCFLRSKVNAAVYQEVLEHFMLPAADQLFMEMQISFSNRTWHLHTVPKLSVPSLRTMVSLYLIGQQTENLWGVVKRKMRYARPKNAEELKATIRATWALITHEQCHRLIDSMPQRIAAVIQAKGAPTKY